MPPPAGWPRAGPVTFNPLFLYGGVGLGKTHLMHAIAHEMQVRRPELRVLYLSAEQFMYRFVQALRDKQIMDFKEMFRSVDVLMVDDVQFIAGKDSTQEEFFHTFNALVDQNKQIVISADRAPGEIKDLEDRIKSRLQCGLVVDLHPTDYELRLGILQQKVDFYRGQYPGLVIAARRAGIPGASDHHQRPRAGRRADPAVRLCQPGRPRDHAGTGAGLPGRHPARFRPQADHRGNPAQGGGALQHPPVRHDRAEAPAHHRPAAAGGDVSGQAADPAQLPEIGRRFGGRDHTTIMHGVRKIEELMATDSQLADDLQLLRRLLQG
jgi:chromosomal replication initiator protein